ncbi:MAG: hypothetical protein Ct9H300mP16_12000 [Pseudomonadota bacterium]|nr:MAG: hypothetical protein Ct9H300mP16_12000 [Pseudomonadota bacterium]
MIPKKSCRPRLPERGLPNKKGNRQNHHARRGQGRNNFPPNKPVRRPRILAVLQQMLNVFFQLPDPENGPGCPRKTDIISGVTSSPSPDHHCANRPKPFSSMSVRRTRCRCQRASASAPGRIDQRAKSVTLLPIELKNLAPQEAQARERELPNIHIRLWSRIHSPELCFCSMFLSSASARPRWP